MILTDANNLLLQGQVALADVERTGIRVDESRLDESIIDIQRRIAGIEERLKASPEWETWRRLHGKKANFGSRVQLGKVMTKLGHESNRTTASGKPAMDEEFLATIPSKFVRRYLRLEKLKKAKSTYLDGLKREVIDGRVHPVFNLNTVETFRSSCSLPNVQNVIVRDEKMMRIVRSCFIPSDGNVLVEADYGQLEYKICACFWLDPTLIEYASDERKDIHRDSAAEIFGLPRKEVSKQSRYVAKNQFVFPQLYGSYYIECAKNIWESIFKHRLQTESGEDMIDALRRQGIDKLGACDPRSSPLPGTFEHRIKEAEDSFYGRFATLKRRMDDWWYAYQQTGEFRLLTGFRISGSHTRNFLMNAPIQGAAFHCLLWSLIRLQREMRRRRMKSRIITEIHDSLLLDAPRGELSELLPLIRQVMTEDIRKVWDWIIVPLKVEIQVAEKDWSRKVEWTDKEGTWGPKAN